MITNVLKSGLFKPMAVLMSGALLLTSSTFPLAGSGDSEAPVNVKTGTSVTISLMDNIDSKTAQTGQTVKFTAVRDVKVDGKVVVEAGSTATGQIVYARDNKLFGIPGRIDVVVKHIQAVDGTMIPIETSAVMAEGHSRMVPAIILTAFCTFGFLIQGSDVTLPAGTQYEAIVRVPTEVNVK